MTTPTHDTKDRILDAAEVLFADQGYDGTSLRAVTGAADVNLAAVHYHFGSKAALFEAVVHRRVDDLNAERLARLDALEARGTPEISEVLEAFVEPAFRLAASDDEGVKRFLRLVGRIHSSSGEHLRSLHRVFQEIAERFLHALAQAAPHLSEADVHWRFHFLLGSMCGVLADPQRVHLTSQGQCNAEDPTELLRQTVAYAAAGFAAPSPRVSEVRP